MLRPPPIRLMDGVPLTFHSFLLHSVHADSQHESKLLLKKVVSLALKESSAFDAPASCANCASCILNQISDLGETS